MTVAVRFSKEHYAKISAALKLRWTDADYRERQDAVRMKRHLAGAFSTNPQDNPALEDFDAQEYGGGHKFCSTEG